MDCTNRQTNATKLRAIHHNKLANAVQDQRNYCALHRGFVQMNKERNINK